MVHGSSHVIKLSIKKITLFQLCVACLWCGYFTDKSCFKWSNRELGLPVDKVAVGSIVQLPRANEWKRLVDFWR